MINDIEVIDEANGITLKHKKTLNETYITNNRISEILLSDDVDKEIKIIIDRLGKE